VTINSSRVEIGESRTYSNEIRITCDNGALEVLDATLLGKRHERDLS